jgi:hypothetical protein
VGTWAGRTSSPAFAGGVKSVLSPSSGSSGPYFLSFLCLFRRIDSGMRRMVWSALPVCPHLEVLALASAPPAFPPEKTADNEEADENS